MAGNKKEEGMTASQFWEGTAKGGLAYFVCYGLLKGLVSIAVPASLIFGMLVEITTYKKR